MFSLIRTAGHAASRGLLVTVFLGTAAMAQDAAWHVGKSSGEVWLTASGVQPVSLSSDSDLKPGDNIRTGRNGRVLLVRGEETILISPNSAIAIPTKAKEGLSTTIIEQAGSILLEVEKRNVQHFEVETPYLAAVVKGTQFSVTVNRNDATVSVTRGEVEVSDFKTGEFVSILPGQSAKVDAHGQGGLSLSGTGTLNPIQKGEPRASTVAPIAVPKGGLSEPVVGPKGHELRIAAPLGELQLDFQKVTKGLARDASGPAAGAKGGKDPYWNSGSSGNGSGGSSGSGSASNGNGNGNGGGNGNGNGGGNGGGNGNGNAGGNGNGNGGGNAAANAAGVPPGLGQSKGNNGNNGNNGNAGGNGNGNANGNGKGKGKG